MRMPKRLDTDKCAPVPLLMLTKSPLLHAATKISASETNNAYFGLKASRQLDLKTTFPSHPTALDVFNDFNFIFYT